MESERHSLGTRGFVAVVSEFNNYVMVHIRKYYQGKPTKFGIALTTKEWRILMNKSKQINDLLEQMQEVLEQQANSPNTEQEELESESFHIGFRGYFALVSEFKKNLLVHVRKFDDDGKPTDKGIAIKPSEWKCLIAKSDEIDKIITHLKEEIKQKNETELKDSKDNLEPPAKKKKCNEHSKIVKRRLFKANV